MVTYTETSERIGKASCDEEAKGLHAKLVALLKVYGTGNDYGDSCNRKPPMKRSLRSKRAWGWCSSDQDSQGFDDPNVPFS